QRQRDQRDRKVEAAPERRPEEGILEERPTEVSETHPARRPQDVVGRQAEVKRRENRAGHEDSQPDEPGGDEQVAPERPPPALDGPRADCAHPPAAAMLATKGEVDGRHARLTYTRSPRRSRLRAPAVLVGPRLHAGIRLGDGALSLGPRLEQPTPQRLVA